MNTTILILFGILPFHLLPCHASYDAKNDDLVGFPTTSYNLRCTFSDPTQPTTLYDDVRDAVWSQQYKRALLIFQRGCQGQQGRYNRYTDGFFTMDKHANKGIKNLAKLLTDMYSWETRRRQHGFSDRWQELDQSKDTTVEDLCSLSVTLLIALQAATMDQKDASTK